MNEMSGKKGINCYRERKKASIKTQRKESMVC